VLGHWPGQWRDASAKQAPHEAGRLSLSARKAQELLQWRPVWGFSQGVEQSVAWYRQHADNPVLSARLTREQIDLYTHRAAQLGLPWATS